jgi:hypothetical protein
MQIDDPDMSARRIVPSRPPIGRMAFDNTTVAGSETWHTDSGDGRRAFSSSRPQRG